MRRSVGIFLGRATLFERVCRAFARGATTHQTGCRLPCCPVRIIAGMFPRAFPAGMAPWIGTMPGRVGARCDREAVTAVTSTLRDSEAAIARASILALVRIGTPEAPRA